MMKKHFTQMLVLLCLLLMIGLAGCVGGNNAPVSIAWDNSIYSPSDMEIHQSELGKQLGEIKRIKKPIPVQNGDSNRIPVGSKIFEIKGIDTNDAIAIERDGKTYKFEKKGFLNK